MNESDLPLQTLPEGLAEFEAAASSWAEARAAHPERTGELDEKFSELITDHRPLLSAHAQSVPHLVRELGKRYHSGVLTRVNSRLREIGRNRGRQFGRNADWELLGTLEESSRQVLSEAPLTSTEKIRLKDLYDAAVQDGRKERLAAERAAAEMHRMLAGRLPLGPLARFWCRPEKLFSLLVSLDGDVRSQALAVFEQRYAFPARQEVLNRISGPLGEAIAAIMDEDLAAGILSYLGYLSPRRLEILYEVERCIWQLPRLERRQIKRKFSELGPNAIFPLEGLPAEIELALRHLLNGSMAEYQSYIIAYDLRQKRYWPLLERLSRSTFEERQRIAAAFQACLSANLPEVLSEALPASALKKFGEALFTEDEERILAWRGQCILEHECDEWLGELLHGKKRKQFLTGYEKVFGASHLERAIAKRYSHRDCEILTDLVRFGKVSRGKLLWFAVAGFGTDEDALVTLLENTDKLSRSKMSAEYAEIWSRQAPWIEKLFPRLFGVLERRIWLECAGDNWVSLRQLLHGGDGERGELERLEEVYKHERSGVMMKKLDFISGEGPVMDRDVSLAREYFSRAVSEQRLAGDSALQFEALIELGELDCGIFRRLKHVIGNVVTTAVAGVGVFIAALSLTVLHVELLSVMCTVGITSLVLRFTLKSLLKGDGYHRDEMMADCGFAVVDGGTLYLGRLFRQAVIQIGARFTSRLGLKTSIARFLRGLREVSTEVEKQTLAELAEPFTGPDTAPDGAGGPVQDEGFRALMRRLYAC